MVDPWTASFFALLKSNHVTQKALAESMGISYQYVCEVLNNKRGSPTSHTIHLFEAGLNNLLVRRKNNERVP